MYQDQKTDEKLGLAPDNNILDEKNQLVLAKKYIPVFEKLFLCPEEKKNYIGLYIKAYSKVHRDRICVAVFSDKKADQGNVEYQIIKYEKGEKQTLNFSDTGKLIQYLKDKWVYSPITRTTKFNPLQLITKTIPSGLLFNDFLWSFCDQKHEKEVVESQMRDLLSDSATSLIEIKNTGRSIYRAAGFYYYFNKNNQLVFSVTYLNYESLSKNLDFQVKTIVFENFTQFFNFLLENSKDGNMVFVNSNFGKARARCAIEYLLSRFSIQSFDLYEAPNVASELKKYLRQYNYFPKSGMPILIRQPHQWFLYARRHHGWSLIPIENQHLFKFLWRCQFTQFNEAKPDKIVLFYGNELSLLSDIFKTYHLYDHHTIRGEPKILDVKEIKSKYETEIKKTEMWRNLSILEQVCASLAHYSNSDKDLGALYFSTAVSFDKVKIAAKAFMYFLMAFECDAPLADPKYARNLANCHYQFLVKDQKFLQEKDLIIAKESIKDIFKLIFPLVIVQLIFAYMKVPNSKVSIYRAVRKKGLFSQDICKEIPRLMLASRPSGSNQVIIKCQSDADLIYEYVALLNKFLSEMHCPAQARCGEGQIIISGISHKDLIKVVNGFKPLTNSSAIRAGSSR